MQPKPQHLSTFVLGHDDFVHDVSFDYYGKRIATCSSDQKIRIWDKITTQEGSEWTMSADLGTGHNAAIWKVQWGDPEFGQIIASCSYDRQVIIWEEHEKKGDKNVKTWVNKGKILFKDSVQDIKFAPKHLGLQIAVAVANGNVEVHEAKDVLSLTNWNPVYDFKTNSTGANCLSWNPAFDEPAMLIVGCNDNS